MARDVLVALLVVSVLVTLAFGVYGVRRRSRPVAAAFAVYMFGTSIWSIGTLGGIFSQTMAATVLWTRFKYIGIVFGTITWVVVAARYTNSESLLSRRRIAALAAFGSLVVLAVWTNDYHGLYYTAVYPNAETITGVDVEHGPLFLVWLVAAYALLLSGCALLARMLYHRKRIYRRQAAAILVAVTAPIVPNVAYVAGVTVADLTPVAFAVSGVMLGWAMHRYEFMSVTPVAREAVVENIRDGVLVVDENDHVVDANPAARALLGVGEDVALVGEQAEDAFDAPFDSLVDRFEDVRRASEVVAFDTVNGKRFLDVDVRPYEARNGRERGRLFYLHDVTDRERRERELKRQNEQLDRFASLVSHDLRNPLNIAEGYVRQAATNDDAAELDASELEEVRAAHDRMRAIIDDVLELTRQGSTVTDVDTVAVADVAERAWQSVDTGSASLDCRASATVVADASRLRQLFENLFRNSVEHGSTSSRTQSDDSVEHGSTGNRTQSGDSVEHGSTGSRTQSDDAIQHGGVDVTVTVGDCDDGFYVADDGPGIPEGEHAAVLTDGYTTHEDGTGLGLSIVKSIADAHDWRIHVDASESGGARFSFTGTTVARSEGQGPVPTEAD